MSGLVPWAPSASMVRYSQASAIAPEVPTTPSSFRDWWKEIRAAQDEKPSHVESAVVGLRQNAEGAAIGALLAFIDTDLGGLDLGGKLPVDWAGAALFYFLSIQGAGKTNGLAMDYRAMGQSCTSVAMYRTVHQWREAKKGIPRNTPQLTGDPVILAGKSKF